VIRPGPALTSHDGTGMIRQRLLLRPAIEFFYRSLGWRKRYKGHDMVIRALPLICAKVPDVRYVIVGVGGCDPTWSDSRSPGVRGRHSIRGEVSDADLDAWYRRCDIFILAIVSHAVGGGSEGYGIVFVEQTSAENL